MAASDILSLAEAHRALNIPTSNVDYDTELAQVISAASQFVDGIDGAVVKRTVTDEEHVGGGSSVQLKYRPVVSITSANEYVGGVATALTAESFTVAGTFSFDPDTGTLYRRSSWYGASFAHTGVRVTYVAGRYDSTATVAEQYKAGCVEALRTLWASYGSGNGVGVVGGDGERFGGFTYSSVQLRKTVAALIHQDSTPVVA